MIPKARTKIALVNMPFSAVEAPAIGLTQLKAVLEEAFPGRFQIAIHYLNHDFHRFLEDPGFYQHVMSNCGYATGLGDWLFRQTAFPAAEHNDDDYFEEYYPDHAGYGAGIRAAVSRIRPKLDQFLAQAAGMPALARADLVGFTTMFSQTTPSLALARKLKEANPDLTVVMGGAACTGTSGLEFARWFDAIDYVFSGPGLVSFPEFIGHWGAGDSAACDRIDGVFSKHNSLPENPRPVALFGRDRNINGQIPLAYDSFLDDFERSFGGTGMRPRLLFETSRGCWWGERSHCSFCGLNGPSLCYHAMSPERAIEQIHSVLRHADRCQYFASTDNILPESYLKEVLPFLKVPEGVQIQYEVRANLDDGQLGVLVAAGVKVIQPGIEALSSDTLKLMRKGTSAFGNIRFLKNCSKHAVFAGYSLLIASPGESAQTYERYLEIIPSLTHLPPPLAVYPIEFVRFSPYVNNPGDHGLELKPEPYFEFIYPLPGESIARIASKFRDANADLDSTRHWLGLLNESVAYWRARWYNEDGRAQARLCFAGEEDDPVIYDSRTGEELEYRIAPDLKRVLEALDQPVRPDTLAAKLTGIDTHRALKILTERNLLFEEAGRFMSLVVP